jgi:phage terminase large subunit-like protein
MLAPWDLSCLDWEKRLREGRSLIPDDLPLNKAEAAKAISRFNRLKLPDVPGTPTLGEAAGDWFREIVAALFGSIDAKTGIRQVKENLTLVPKKNSKTTNAAALMLTALMMNRRPRAEFLLVGPTQATSETAFNQAVGMIQADEQLAKRFHVQDHIKKITFHGKVNGKVCQSFLQIKTFDTRVLVGVKPVGVLIDELHELGRVPYAGRVLTQLRGGQLPFPESFLIFITTQSDEPPAGIFRSELTSARMIRDGIEPANGRLPVLYEFPASIIESGGWKDPANWPMITPNLDRSITLDRLKTDFENEVNKGEEYLRRWASQHLNLEIGLSLRSDRWAGADYWEAHADPSLTFEELLKRSEVITVGGDGGGLDDLFGFAAIGREKGTGRWLHWAHAWAHPIVMERRKEVATSLRQFEQDGDLTFVEHVGDDVEEAADMVRAIDDAGLLPQERAIGVDRIGIGSLIEALARRNIVSSDERQRIVAINQGFMLSGAIKDTERALAGGKIVHAGQPLMAWCVSNARVEPKGNAISITKQISGSAKIDPLMATFDAAALMAMNPEIGVNRALKLAILQRGGFA